MMSVKQAAQLWKISERRVRLLCEAGAIPGARRGSKSWEIPGDTRRPPDRRRRNAAGEFAAVTDLLIDRSAESHEYLRTVRAVALSYRLLVRVSLPFGTYRILRCDDLLNGSELPRNYDEALGFLLGSHLGREEQRRVFRLMSLDALRAAADASRTEVNCAAVVRQGGREKHYILRAVFDGEDAVLSLSGAPDGVLLCDGENALRLALADGYDALLLWQTGSGTLRTVRSSSNPSLLYLSYITDPKAFLAEVRDKILRPDAAPLLDGISLASPMTNAGLDMRLPLRSPEGYRPYRLTFLALPTYALGDCIALCLREERDTSPIPAAVREELSGFAGQYFTELFEGIVLFFCGGDREYFLRPFLSRAPGGYLTGDEERADWFSRFAAEDRPRLTALYAAAGEPMLTVHTADGAAYAAVRFSTPRAHIICYRKLRGGGGKP